MSRYAACARPKRWKPRLRQARTWSDSCSFPRSPRHLQYSEARTLAAQVGGRAERVALTVDADDAMLASIIEALQPDLLQLHGSESIERVADIRARFGLPVDEGDRRLRAN